MTPRCDRVFVPLLWIIPAVLLIGVISMPRQEYIADPMVVRCETVSLINTGSLEIPRAIVQSFRGEKGQFFFENSSNGKAYSKYGIMNGLLNVPPLLVEKWCEGTLPYYSPSRVIYLNIFNLILSVASACYLCLIASRYTSSSLIITIFVLTAFYCTYWWNYLRAQNSEIYQSLFMLAFYYHLVSYFKPPLRDRDQMGATGANVVQLSLAGFFLGLLILVKTFYVLLFPVLFLWILFVGYLRSRSDGKAGVTGILMELIRPMLFLFAPIIVSLVILLAADAYKFGSPFETGYGQWQESGKPIFSGNFLAGIEGFFFDIQWSIFSNFPLLVFAMFGYPRFFKTYPSDASLFLGVGIIMLLLFSKMLNPFGTWGYGPRYMLVILPLLSLPFIKTLEIVVGAWPKWWSLGCSLIIAVTLLYSFRLQLNVNALPFFTYFRLQGLFAQFHDTRVDQYFVSHAFGTINGDVLAAKQGASWEPLALVGPRLDPQSLDRLRMIIVQETPSNYYWWH